MSHLNPAGAYPQAYHIALDLDAVDFEDPGPPGLASRVGRRRRPSGPHGLRARA